MGMGVLSASMRAGLQSGDATSRAVAVAGRRRRERGHEGGSEVYLCTGMYDEAAAVERLVTRVLMAAAKIEMLNTEMYAACGCSLSPPASNNPDQPRHSSRASPLPPLVVATTPPYDVELDAPALH